MLNQTLAGLLGGPEPAPSRGPRSLDYFVRPGAGPLLLLGPVGSGKSFLAANFLCRALVRKPRTAVVDYGGAHRRLARHLNADGASSPVVHRAEPEGSADYTPRRFVDLVAQQRRLIDDDGAAVPAFKILLLDAPWALLSDDAVSRHIPALAQLWHERNGLLIVAAQYTADGAPSAGAVRRLVAGFPDRVFLADPDFGAADARAFGLRPGVHAEVRRLAPRREALHQRVGGPTRRIDTFVPPTAPGYWFCTTAVPDVDVFDSEVGRLGLVDGLAALAARSPAPSSSVGAGSSTAAL